MKREYSKPTIYVEPMIMDTPIALGCTADKEDMKALVTLGYFTQNEACSFNINDIDWGDDTICYHGNVQTAFYS